MKKIILSAILLVCLGIAGYTFYTSWRMQDPAFQRERTMGAVDNGRMLQTADADRKLVSLDELALLRPRKEGTRDLIAPEPIAFDAAVKQAPQEIKTDYLKEALSVLRVSPMPTINHRMFVETAQGRVMPVYVWDNVADEFDPSEQPQRMVGYHVYTYAKGPAIVVDGVI